MPSETVSTWADVPGGTRSPERKHKKKEEERNVHVHRLKALQRIHSPRSEGGVGPGEGPQTKLHRRVLTVATRSVPFVTVSGATGMSAAVGVGVTQNYLRPAITPQTDTRSDIVYQSHRVTPRPSHPSGTDTPSSDTPARDVKEEGKRSLAFDETFYQIHFFFSKTSDTRTARSRTSTQACVTFHSDRRSTCWVSSESRDRRVAQVWAPT